MNIIDKTDEEIMAIADPWWDDLVQNSNEGNYGRFVRNFSYDMCLSANEVEMGKQFAKSGLAKSLSSDKEYLGMIRRGQHVTVLFKQTSTKKEGEWLGRMVLGYEKEDIKIFGVSLF